MRILNIAQTTKYPNFPWQVAIEGFLYELNYLEDLSYQILTGTVICGSRMFSRDIWSRSHNCIVGQHIQWFYSRNKRDTILFVLNNDIDVADTVISGNDVPS